MALAAGSAAAARTVSAHACASAQPGVSTPVRSQRALMSRPPVAGRDHLHAIISATVRPVRERSDNELARVCTRTESIWR